MLWMTTVWVTEPETQLLDQRWRSQFFTSCVIVVVSGDTSTSFAIGRKSKLLFYFIFLWRKNEWPVILGSDWEERLPRWEAGCHFDSHWMRLILRVTRTHTRARARYRCRVSGGKESCQRVSPQITQISLRHESPCSSQRRLMLARPPRVTPYHCKRRARGVALKIELPS